MAFHKSLWCYGWNSTIFQNPVNGYGKDKDWKKRTERCRSPGLAESHKRAQSGHPQHINNRVVGSAHSFKYSLAYVIHGMCVLRYDNEAGKGDHLHFDGEESSYHLSV